VSRDLRAGFTLLEMMAVIVLMSLVLGVATNVYLDLSRASYAATTETGAARRAMVLLDRVARDLEGAVLVTKPPETDPLEWSWLFLAESESPDAGADRVKFVRRGRTPRSSDLPESDLEVVAWMLAESEDGTLALRRAGWPQLPESLDRSFPDEEHSDLVADGIASFGIRLLGEGGTWTGRWDSSQLADSGALPIAAEIEIAFVDENGAATEPLTRKVCLPLRPPDLAAKLAEAEGQQPGQEELVVEDEDGDGDIDEDDRAIAEERRQQEQADGGDGDGSDDGDAGSAVTLAECMARDPSVNATVQALIASSPILADSLQSLMSAPVAIAAQQAGVPVPAACQ